MKNGAGCKAANRHASDRKSGNPMPDKENTANYL
jgi:hypothetical protein